MTNCSDKTNAECILARAKDSLKNRPQSSYEQRQPRKGACIGTDKLNKKTFLSMIGAKKYTPPGTTISFLDAQRLATMQDALDENDSNIMLAAASLGISPSVFRKRYNALSSVVNSTTIQEPASPTPERRFFENVTNPWSITSFNPKTKEVCIDVQSSSVTTHFSSKVPDYRV
jgi:hypothetical protein